MIVVDFSNISYVQTLFIVTNIESINGFHTTGFHKYCVIPSNIHIIM